MSHMGSLNEGPANIIPKVSGEVKGGKHEDDGIKNETREPLPIYQTVAMRALPSINNLC